MSNIQPKEKEFFNTLAFVLESQHAQKYNKFFFLFFNPTQESWKNFEVNKHKYEKRVLIG